MVLPWKTIWKQQLVQKCPGPYVYGNSKKSTCNCCFNGVTLVTRCLLSSLKLLVIIYKALCGLGQGIWNKALFYRYPLTCPLQSSGEDFFCVPPSSEAWSVGTRERLSPLLHLGSETPYLYRPARLFLFRPLGKVWPCFWAGLLCSVVF